MNENIDLDAVAHNVEYIAEREIKKLVETEELKDFQIKTLETLAKIVTICRNWRKDKPELSPFDAMDLEELTKEFE